MAGYDDFYSRGDFIHFTQDRTYINQLCSFLPDPTHSRVLDVGCGRGYWTRLFLECGVGQVTGIDLSPVAVELAKHLVSEGRFLAADASHLPFEDKTFDTVFCQGLSLYNTVDLPKTRELGIELLRCCKDNGLLVFAMTTNLSGKLKRGFRQHKLESVISYLESLDCQIVVTYFIDRFVFLRLLGRNVFKPLFARYTIPFICHLTGLPGLLVCVTRKKQ